MISVVGPTAIGKTSLAIALAQAFSSEIISADSRQFFKEMKVGTAVPSMEELSAVKHHFIQQTSISKSYSVGDFEREAIEKMEHLFLKHPILFMVGGSGLYVDAVNKGLDKFPKVDPSIRSQLNEEFNKNGLISLQKRLQQLDSSYFKKVDLQNPQRVIRALEVCIASGEPYSRFLNQTHEKRNFTSIKIGLTAPRELIYERINHRVDLMMEDGLLAEVEKLYPYKNLNALNTVGYKELFQYIDGEKSLPDAVEEIKKNTRRFAKRQLTWFRKDQGITWFQHDCPTGDILGFIKQETSLQ